MIIELQRRIKRRFLRQTIDNQFALLPLPPRSEISIPQIIDRLKFQRIENKYAISDWHNHLSGLTRTITIITATLITITTTIEQAESVVALECRRTQLSPCARTRRFHRSLSSSTETLRRNFLILPFSRLRHHRRHHRHHHRHQPVRANSTWSPSTCSTKFTIKNTTALQIPSPTKIASTGKWPSLTISPSSSRISDSCVCRK